MIPVFTFDEIREIEKNIIENEKVPSIILMENAGKNSFDVIAKEIKDLRERDIYVICGKGNNAGDGFTFVRHCLANEISATIVMVVDPTALKGDALINYEMLKKLKIENQKEDGLINEMTFDDFKSLSKKLSKNAIIIDAILGTGIKGQLDRTFVNTIEFINN